MEVLATLIRSPEQPLGFKKVKKTEEMALLKCRCSKLVLVLKSSFGKSPLEHCRSCASRQRGQNRLSKEFTQADLTHKSWEAMKERARNVKKIEGKDWIDPSWFDFQSFLKDMGPRVSSELSIDRIDNSKGYFPGNCRWATWNQQGRNKSNTVKITYSGKTLSCGEWADELNSGLSSAAIWRRFRQGWTTFEIFYIPLNHKRKPKEACKHGHPFIPENTEISFNKEGLSYRRCKSCRKARRRSENDRKKETKRASFSSSLDLHFNPEGEALQPFLS